MHAFSLASDASISRCPTARPLMTTTTQQTRFKSSVLVFTRELIHNCGISVVLGFTRCRGHDPRGRSCQQELRRCEFDLV